MTSDRIDELIALAALGELSPSEARELDDVARADPAAAGELDEALAAAAALQRTTATEPPPAMRDAVMAAIAVTPQETAEPSDVAGAVADGPSAPVSLDAHRARRSRLATVVAAAAAALILVVGATVLVASRDDGSGDQIAAVVGADDASTRILTGELEVMVTYSESTDAMVVEGARLPTLDESETYQLWLIGNDGATSAGVFRPDSTGTVSARFDGIDPTGFELGVTEEPAGGSDTPTLPILASA